MDTLSQMLLQASASGYGTPAGPPPLGATWGALGIIPRISSIGYNGSIYVAVGEAGAVFTSTNLTTWTLQTTRTANGYNKVAWDGSKFIAIAADFIESSLDGLTWTTGSFGTSSSFYNFTGTNHFGT